MERASKLIRKLGLPGETMSLEELVCAAWPMAVGKKVAVHTRAARLVREHLVVEVEDKVWQNQLFALTPHILRNLEKSIGSGLVTGLEFRIVPRRREPQRAVAATAAAAPPLFRDEADAIGDPVMRDIYKASRLRAVSA